MDKAAMQHLIEGYINAYNRFDVDGMLSGLHPDIQFENYSGENVTLATIGIDAFRQAAEQAITAFQSRQQHVEQIGFGDHSATVHIDYEAVLAIDLTDELKAGDTLRLKGKSVFRFQDDTIIHLADYS